MVEARIGSKLPLTVLRGERMVTIEVLPTELP